MTQKYTNQKQQGLEYKRSIQTIVSEIEAELNTIKAIKNIDPVKKPKLKIGSRHK